MDAKIKEQIDDLLEQLDKAGTFIQPATTEEVLRDFLASDIGPEWRNAALQTNEMFGYVVYTATLMKMLGGKWYSIVHVVDRDSAGRFYVGDPSPVAGYE